ncbi:hypothetical protein AB6A40_007187 [Gnathostoma spinigerum]|uniref:Uncharacterized protein n=1 Tax=Gnathostoma spinigerum TaxID=75299 RepID=A0ABD6EKS2_9BILA
MVNKREEKRRRIAAENTLDEKSIQNLLRIPRFLWNTLHSRSDEHKEGGEQIRLLAVDCDIVESRSRHRSLHSFSLSLVFITGMQHMARSS